MIYTDQYPYHVVTRTNNKCFFQLPLPDVFSLFESWINISQLLYETETYHFELMSNHIHWILRTPQANLSQVVRHVLTNVSKDMNTMLGHQNHVFGGR